jgi:hypothetical protein
MSRSSVRSAVTSYLQNLPGVTNLYRDAPWELLGDQWAQAASGLPGTPGFIHIAKQGETRQTVGGMATIGPPGGVNGGSKVVTYDVGIMFLYQYVIPAAPTDKVTWVDGLDTLLDATFDRLRADPTMGAPGVIWSSGQEPDGITVQSDLPTVVGGVVLAWNRVDVKVRETVQA